MASLSEIMKKFEVFRLIELRLEKRHRPHVDVRGITHKSDLGGKYEVKLALEMRRIRWEALRAAIESEPTVVSRLSDMEQLGHQPGVYHMDEGYFWFATSAPEVPLHTRGVPFGDGKGSATQMAREMGLELISRGHYFHLQRTYENEGDDSNAADGALTCGLDKLTSSWLDAGSRSGWALVGRSQFEGRFDHANLPRQFVEIDERPSNEVRLSRGWRGIMKVRRVDDDRTQVPFPYPYLGVYTGMPVLDQPRNYKGCSYGKDVDGMRSSWLHGAAA